MHKLCIPESCNHAMLEFIWGILMKFFKLMNLYISCELQRNPKIKNIRAKLYLAKSSLGREKKM